MKKALFIPIRDMVVFPGVITPIFVGRKKSVETLEKIIADGSEFLLFMQKDKLQESPDVAKDIHAVGVSARILQTVKMPDGTIKVLVEILERVKMKEVMLSSKFYEAEYSVMEVEKDESEETEAIKRQVLEHFEKYIKLTNNVSPELILNLRSLEETEKVFNLLASNLMVSSDKKQLLIEIDELNRFGYEILSVIQKEIEIVSLEKKIDNKVKDQINNLQKGYYLREKIKAIKEELGDGDSIEDEVDELKQAIEKAKLPKTVEGKLYKELAKLEKMPAYSAETSVARTYIETVLELPWNKKSKDSLDIVQAMKVLEAEHYGLKEVKERIVEFLAVKKLNKKLSGSVLCLVGPPGVGKTSLAQSIAHAMGRKFVRSALGGVRDEAEIRGHRRTYVGAMPGRIMKELKTIQANNPVFLLDEIDKLASDFRGDPTSALLEVLDPEQNHAFGDHYVDMPFDLSNVFFIATANDLWQIPGPLRDRLEIIELNSYTEIEKYHIAERYLVQRAKEENGLHQEGLHITFSKEALYEIIRGYTREAGVRHLQRELSKVCRKIAKEVVERNITKLQVTKNNVHVYLGDVKYKPEAKRELKSKIGTVNGMAWTSVGGTLLEVQSVAMPGKGKLSLTGKLGDVMKESAQVAFSCVRSIADKYGIAPDFYEKNDVHLHFPEGAVPKDGPSAGITITTALLSVLSQKPVPCTIAMTGEITISNEVLPVGGILEKVIGAHRAGCTTIILPDENRNDAKKLPKEVTKDITIHFAKTYDDVAKIVFEQR